MTPYQILQAACEKILQSRSSRPDEIARAALDAAAKARLADDEKLVAILTLAMGEPYTEAARAVLRAIDAYERGSK